MRAQQSWWRGQLRACVAAFTFLTRLPVARLIQHDLTDLANSASYFPLVGLCVGAIGTIAFAAAEQLWNPTTAVVISVIATVFVTGAFHEDALADSLDGFGGGWTKEQVLSIMKDSRVGSYALIGMVLATAVKISALRTIHEQAASISAARAFQTTIANVAPLGRALVAAHVLARLSSVWLIRSHEYVRADNPTARASAGRPFVNAVTNSNLAFATILSLLIVCAVLPAQSIAVVVSAAACTWLAGRYFNRRIGGITGDALGAANQFVELVVYLVLAAHPLAITFG